MSATTMNSPFWILEKQDSRRLLPETLERTRQASYVAGANSLDTTIADLKSHGWRAVKIELDYYGCSAAREAR